MEIPTYPDAVAVVIGYLRTALARRTDSCLERIAIGTEVPPGRDPLTADPFLKVRRSGGVASWPVLDRPRLDFMVWHRSLAEANAAANVVRSLLFHDMPGLQISGHVLHRPSEFSGPIPFPDPAGSNTPIVMFTHELPIRIAKGGP